VRLWLAIASAFVLALSALRASAETKPDIAALADRAARLNAIEEDGATPYVLVVEFSVDDSRHQTRRSNTGTFTKIWLSKDLWRSDIKTSDYAETEWMTAKRLHRLSTTRYRPSALKSMALLLMPPLIAPDPPEWKKITRSRIDGRTVDCLEGKREGLRVKLCVEVDSGHIVLKQESSPGYKEISRFEGALSLSSKYLPRKAMLETEGLRIALEVKRFEPAEAVPPDVLEPDPRAVSVPACFGKLLPPKVVHKPEPAYSPQARSLHLEGATLLVGIVGIDGRFHDIEIDIPLQHLDVQAVEAVKEWRFDPATCDGVPFPLETHIETWFKLN
jgi:hypothetical protein